LRIKRITRGNPGKAGEVAIGGQELADAMFHDQRRDVRVVRKIAGRLTCL
jgi:hypothetical protein